MFCKPTSWNDRSGFVLSNGVVQLTTLTGGGHVAELQLHQPGGQKEVSPLWVPPWQTIEPYRYAEDIHGDTYGPMAEGKLLSGIVGHNICLDYFGLPSPEETKQGLSLHGEAPSTKWEPIQSVQNDEQVALELSATLPAAALNLTRRIELISGESVVYFRETVRNQRQLDHIFHWAEHVTLGEPFLSCSDSTVALNGDVGVTFPYGYDEGNALLPSNQQFDWPNVHSIAGEPVDLCRPFLKDGFGFVVAVRVKKSARLGFIAAINPKLGLLVAYCFRRRDFPWIAVWEENRATAAPPWRKRTRARGLEFSSTPFPVVRREAMMRGPLLSEDTVTYVPAAGEKTVEYAALLARVPESFGNVSDIQLDDTGFRIDSDSGNRSILIAAPGASEFLFPRS